MERSYRKFEASGAVRVSGLFWLLALTTLLLGGAVRAVEAQGFPWPARVGEPVAYYNDEPTWQYSSPWVDHTGRFLDSQGTATLQVPRTLRAKRTILAPERNRVYFIWDSHVSSFALDRFFASRIGSPMKSYGRGGINAPGEDYLEPDSWFYAEKEWPSSVADGQPGIRDLAYDDRGYLYVGSYGLGWGIVRDTGTLSNVWSESLGIDSNEIELFTHSGNYYVIFTGQRDGQNAIYNVTTPASPTLVRKLSTKWVLDMAVAQAGGVTKVALVTISGLEIYNASGLLSGAAPVQTFTASRSAEGARYQSIESDGTNFFVVESADKKANLFSLSILAPDGGGSYTRTTHQPSGVQWAPTNGSNLRYGQGGYLTLIGYSDTSLTQNVTLLKLNGLTPERIDLGSYIPNYYTAPPSGYARPGYSNVIYDGLAYQPSDKLYYFHSNGGLGDVFELQGGPVAPVAPDPKITKNGCVTEGKSCSFEGSSLLGANTSGWSWQWKLDGVNKSTSRIWSPSPALTAGTYSVSLTATNEVGTNSTSINVTISPPQAPDPKITVSGCTTIGGSCSLTGGSASGDDFSDWTWQWKDNGTNTSTSRVWSPSLTEGTHTITLVATNSVGSNQAQTSVTLTEAPACASAPPSSDFLNLTWRGSSTGCTTSCNPREPVEFNVSAWGYFFQDCDEFHWDFDNNGSTDRVTTGPDGVTTVWSYSSDGTYTAKVTVKNSVGTGGSKTATVKLGPAITCSTPSTPSLSAPSSATSGQGYTLSWTSVNGVDGYDIQEATNSSFSGASTFTNTGTSRSFTHTVSSSTTYYYRVRSRRTCNSQLYESNWSTTRTTTVEPGSGGSSCSTAPGFGIEFDYLGQTSQCSRGSTGCQLNETIKFTPKKTWTYDLQDCDELHWDFGDGTPVVKTSKDDEPTHTFTTGGNKTVTLTVKNSLGSADPFTQILTFGPAATPPTSADFTWTPVSPVVGQEVTLTGSAAGGDPIASWSWNIAGTNASGQTVKNTFTTAGEKSVTLTASNSGGGKQVIKTITVTQHLPFTFLLPAVIHADGDKGSVWRTDLQVYVPDFPSTGAIDATFEFNGELYDGETWTQTQIVKQVQIDASTYVKLREEFRDLITSSDLRGTVIIRGSAPHAPQIWTRVYSVSSNGVGTYGQLVPAVPLTSQQSATEGTIYSSLSALKNDSAADTGYRTNVGFVNGSNVNASFNVRVFSQLGVDLGTFTVSLAAYQAGQLSLSTWFPDILGQGGTYSLRIENDSAAQIYAYASIVDNVSNDPIFIGALTDGFLSGAAQQDVALPSMGKFAGWQSDMSIFNPNPAQPIFVHVYYHDRSGALLAKRENLPILPLETIVIDDVLSWPLFVPGITVESIGAVRVVTPTPPDIKPVIYARTYKKAFNVDNGKPETYGQGYPAFPVSLGNVKLGTPGIIAGIRRDLSYYTNLGLVNLSPETTKVKVTLLDPLNGSAIGTPSTITLDPSASPIIGSAAAEFIESLDPNASSGSLRIEVIEGGPVWAFVQIIDRLTSDPEYVPAVPVQ